VAVQMKCTSCNFPSQNTEGPLQYCEVLVFVFLCGRKKRYWKGSRDSDKMELILFQ
jgi:hypothetical protein